jgi:hypothetical protein
VVQPFNGLPACVGTTSVLEKAPAFQGRLAKGGEIGANEIKIKIIDGQAPTY